MIQEKVVISDANILFDLLSVNLMDGFFAFPDCSVLYLAEQRKGRLLTGDKHLRFFAESLGVPVSGILYLFDCLVDKGILSPKEASEKLECLQQINPRLPAVECMDRISVWRGTEQQ